MIDPFRGFRPTEGAGPLADVTSPPYDRIPAPLLETLRARSRCNAVHLIRGEAGPSDLTWHAQAAVHMKEWIEQGFIARDETPAYYILKQSFELPVGGRRERCAVVGALDLAHQSRVHHHERTHARAKEDRLALLRAAGTHFGQIFILRKGKEPLDVAGIRAREIGTVEAEEGVTTSISVVEDEDAVQRLSEHLRDASYVIADGHHRFTTACTYHEETPAADHVMVSIVDLEDPGLCVLPTHRLLRDLPAKRVTEVLSSLGSLTDVPAGTDPIAALSNLEPGRILLVGSDGLPRLWDNGRDASEGAEGLDVAVLENRLLKPLLAELDVEDHLSYHRDPAQALGLLGRGEACLLALLAPIAPGVVVDIALSGAVMPQKSTDFFPKIPTGLVYLATEAAPFL